ncbi:MAG TPA: hypothetical protein VMW75_10700 [Thermoanaerobaculia bacterium]|nr:hypothetical protein [Thermoanaerobaculia bacterium]
MRANLFALCSSLLALAHSLHAATEVASVPAHVELCKTVVVADASALGTPAARDATFKAAVGAIIACAQSLELRNLGVPFARSAETTAERPSELKITFCAIAVTTAEPCPGISRRDVAPERVIASICSAGAAASCRAEVETALKGEPWKLDDRSIQQLQWRFAQTATSINNSTDVAAALVATPVAIGAGAVPAGGNASFVVVAAPLPAVPPPSPPPPAAPTPGTQQPAPPLATPPPAAPPPAGPQPPAPPSATP